MLYGNMIVSIKTCLLCRQLTLPKGTLRWAVLDDYEVAYCQARVSNIERTVEGNERRVLTALSSSGTVTCVRVVNCRVIDGLYRLSVPRRGAGGDEP
jgi:hypothetical protein